MPLLRLFKLEESFEPHLKSGDYTFVAPAKPSLFKTFLVEAIRIALNEYQQQKSIHYVLSNRQVTREALSNVAAKGDARVYVVLQQHNEHIFFHDVTIEQYCEINQIAFSEDVAMA